MRNVAALLFILLMPSAAFAQTAKPPELAPYIHAAVPYGQGTLTKLWIHAYDATLWTDASTWSMDAPFALSLRYGTDFNKEELVSRSIQEMQRSGALSAEQVASYTQQLGAIFSNVNEGDIITALYMPGKGARFFYNGKPSGTIKDQAFAQQFIDIWMSPNTSEPKLRNTLLGMHS